MPRERTLQATILRRLNATPGCKARNTHGGAFGRAGEPDIIGCLGGRTFVLEVKRPGELPRRIQEHRLREWREAGAVAACVTSWAETQQALGLGDCVPEGATPLWQWIQFEPSGIGGSFSYTGMLTIGGPWGEHRVLVNASARGLRGDDDLRDNLRREIASHIEPLATAKPFGEHP